MPGVVGWRFVTPEYFKALGILIKQGRPFEERDRHPTGNAIILSQALARVLFPEDDAVGRRVRVSIDGPWLTVVGIAQDVRNAGLAGPSEPEFYVVRQRAADYGLGNQITLADRLRASVIVRSTLGRVATANRIKAEVAALDPTTPVTVNTMEQRVRQLTARPRFIATLLLLFAGVALGLAAIGLYGVIWYLVAEGTREIGVRIALGATTGQITRSIIRQAATWTIIGTALGLASSSIAREAIGALIFGVPESDGRVTVVAVAILFAVAFSASWLPSRRAGRIDAMTALRHE